MLNNAKMDIDESKYLKLKKSKKSFWLSSLFVVGVYIFYMFLLGFIAGLLNTTTPILAITGTLLFVLILSLQAFVWKGVSYYIGGDFVLIVRRVGVKRIPIEPNDQFTVYTGFLGKFFNSGDYSISNPLTGNKFTLTDIHDPYGTLKLINERFPKIGKSI